MILEFRKSIADTKQLRLLYKHLVEELNLPGDYSDLLRMNVVYCMSGLDKLIHDIVIHEMVEIFSGRRPPTPKYLAESISLENHGNLITSSIPPPELVFEGIVRRKLGYQSFMDPNKLVEALSLVWLENHKWQAISDYMRRDKGQVTTELRNIFQRRNAIVHEADKAPLTSEKLEILTSDSERVEQFVSDLGESIFHLV